MDFECFPIRIKAIVDTNDNTCHTINVFNVYQLKQ